MGTYPRAFIAFHNAISKIGKFTYVFATLLVELRRSIPIQRELRRDVEIVVVERLLSRRRRRQLLRRCSRIILVQRQFVVRLEAGFCGGRRALLPRRSAYPSPYPRRLRLVRSRFRPHRVHAVVWHRRRNRYRFRRRARCRRECFCGRTTGLLVLVFRTIFQDVRRTGFHRCLVVEDYVLYLRQVYSRLFLSGEVEGWFCLAHDIVR